MDRSYKPKEFSKMIGVSVQTLQRWDNAGILKARRTPTNRRYYTHGQYVEYMGMRDERKGRKTVIYARVSSRPQRDDLGNQVAFLRRYCVAMGMEVDECIEDFGSGLNYGRKRWNALLDEVMDGDIETIVVSHKDRFVRFGFEWFERLCARFGTGIVVADDKDSSPQEELVQDIVSILHVFGCRLYGLRKYKKQIEEDEGIAESV